MTYADWCDAPATTPDIFGSPPSASNLCARRSMLRGAAAQAEYEAEWYATRGYPRAAEIARRNAVIWRAMASEIDAKIRDMGDDRNVQSLTARK